MKLSSLFFFLLPQLVFSFKSVMPTKPEMKTFHFNGDIKPTGFFDPLQLTTNSKESTVKYMREAELHHGRIAMVSSVVLPILDLTQKSELAINSLHDSSVGLNQASLFAMGMFELARMVGVYERPKDGLFKIKDNVEPGQLNLYYKFNEDLSNKELSNGRLAMIGAAGYLAQEFVTQQKIF